MSNVQPVFQKGFAQLIVTLYTLSIYPYLHNQLRECFKKMYLIKMYLIDFRVKKIINILSRTEKTLNVLKVSLIVVTFGNYMLGKSRLR